MKSFILGVKQAFFTTVKAYGMSVLVFVFGCIPFFALGPNTFRLYSALALIMQICIIYSFVNKCAFREVRDNQVGSLGQFKGFVTGAISMIPFILVMVLAEFLLPASADWTVAPDISGLVQIVMAYGGYFYYGAYSSIWFKLTALIFPVVFSGLAYIAAIRKFDVDYWINVHILKKEVPEDNESGYDYFKRTGRKF